MDIEALIKRAKPPERAVSICMDAALTARHDQLQAQLDEAGRGTSVTMADTGGGKAIAEQIQAVEAEMTAQLVTFRMRGLSSYKKHEWEQKHPPRKDTREAFNLATAPPALIALACVAIYPAGEDDADHPSADEPVLTGDQAERLCRQIGHGQTDRLFSAAWQATNGDGTVPHSAAASATIHGSAKR